jgi:hypothetical protein
MGELRATIKNHNYVGKTTTKDSDGDINRFLSNYPITVFQLHIKTLAH